MSLILLFYGMVAEILTSLTNQFDLWVTNCGLNLISKVPDTVSASRWGFWPRFYILVLGITFFFNSNLLFPISIWTFILFFCWTFISLLYLDSGLLFPFSIWTFPLFYLDFFFISFHFRLLFLFFFDFFLTLFQFFFFIRSRSHFGFLPNFQILTAILQKYIDLDKSFFQAFYFS